MNQRELEKCRRRLGNRWPLFWKVFQRRAVRMLVADSSAEAVPLLAESLRLRDSKVRAVALGALRDLKSPGAIDALCGMWAKGRDAMLGGVIAERRYVARSPVELRVLSALKSGSLDMAAESAEGIPALVAALKDTDHEVARVAERVLRDLNDREMVEALCGIVIRQPSSPAARICIETGKRPADPEDACLFLFVTRQIDDYFKEDFEFQNLHLAYERADAAIRSHVMDVMRSGDRRCLGFFGSQGRKALSQCSEEEIKLAVESALRHNDWPRLFSAFLEMPLKYGLPLVEHFRRARWAPDKPDLKSLYQQVLAETDSNAALAQRDAATTPVFEKWLEEGRSGQQRGLETSVLLERLTRGAPREAVVAVAALASKGERTEKVVSAVRNSPHWLARLAGYATGLCGELTAGETGEPNFWVRELAGLSVLEFWPVKATPDDVERLAASPPEAWTGMLGRARRVLRLLIGHRVTVGTFEEMAFEAGEFAGEFEEADI